MPDPSNDNAERNEQIAESKSRTPADAADAPADYYYDDATGYEIYRLNDDDEESPGSAAPVSNRERDV